MATKPANVVEEKLAVNATPEVAFAAITSALDLSGWLCNEARCEVRPGGMFELWWNSGYAVRGKVKKVDRPHLFSVSWLGSGEQRETSVTFTLADLATGTEITVQHGGFGQGAKWAAAMEESRKGWASSLKNLAHLVDTGIDLREASRPMLGVFLGEQPNAERLAQERSAAMPGVYLAGVIDGLSAQAAGLKAHDLIISVGGMPTPGDRSIAATLQGHVAGDHVEVVYMRGNERHSVSLELKPRPMPDLPFDIPSLITVLRERYARVNATIEHALAGASEDKAARSPTADGWSAKQIMAHLCATERLQHYIIATAWVGDQVLNTPGNPTAAPAVVAAVLSLEPTAAGLLRQLRREEEMTLALFAAIPPEMAANRARVRRTAAETYRLFDHIDEHVEQFQQALAAP